MGTRDRRSRIKAWVDEAGMARIADLAMEFQVSQMTVRRDLDQLAADSQVTRVRGGATRSTGNQLGHATAAATRGRHLGIVVPRSDYVYQSVLASIHESLIAAGATSSLLVSNYSKGLERQLVDQLITDGVDGLLFAPTLDEEKPDYDFLDWLTQLPIPVVLVERRLPDHWGGRPISSVRTSFPRGLALAASYLCSLGHQGIGFFGHAARIDVGSLEQVWIKIVEDLGLNVSVSPFLVDRDYRHWQSISEPQTVLSQMLDAGVTALICRDDPVALTMVNCIRRMGLRIPEDLSVMSYDDEIANMCDPPLSAVSTPKEDVGRYASDLILRLIHRFRDRETGTTAHVELEPSIVVRSSTSQPAVS